MFSDFGNKLCGESGILKLMEDLGKPLPDGVKSYALGGGNPAQIPEVERLYRAEMERIMKDGRVFEDLIGRYDGPQGRISFIEAVAEYLSKTYGWKIGPENIAVTNGSQSACFYLFNLLSGTFTSPEGKKQKRTVLFPLVPEYIGYADQCIEPDTFVSIKAGFEEYSNHTFKYFADIPRLEDYLSKHPEVAAMCVSRPTNPTGNVLSNAEIEKMSLLAHEYGIPLIIDNAYGLPWPHIIFNDEAKPVWNPDIILSMSLSKIGLPSLRTGIIVAKKEIVAALSNLNSIIALASGSVGQAVAENLIKNGTLVKAADEYVMPFYHEKNLKAQNCIHKYFAGENYSIHKGEGSIFLWLLLKDLKISTKELYVRLKKRGVVVVPGEYFFFGEGSSGHPHYDKCLRLNYARPDEELDGGLKILSEVYKDSLLGR